MNKAAKRLIGMRQDPKGWRIGDVESVCKESGITCSPPKRGSHYKISHPGQAEILTIPANRPIKPVYIKKLVAFIDRTTEKEYG